MSTFEFTPGIGYFVANNLALGVMVSLESLNEKEVDDDKYTETTTMLLPYAVLYFRNSYERARLGIGASITELIL